MTFFVLLLALMGASMTTILLNWLAARECARLLDLDVPSSWLAPPVPTNFRWAWFPRIEAIVREGQIETLAQPKLRRAVRQYKVTRFLMAWVIAPSFVMLLVWAYLAG